MRPRPNRNVSRLVKIPTRARARRRVVARWRPHWRARCKKNSEKPKAGTQRPLRTQRPRRKPSFFAFLCDLRALRVLCVEAFLFLTVASRLSGTRDAPGRAQGRAIARVPRSPE